MIQPLVFRPGQTARPPGPARRLQPLLKAGLGLGLCCGLLWPAAATEERPAIGIGGNRPLVAGQIAKVLVSHASHPQLEAFAVSVTYLGPLPQTEELGHPNADGVLYWTPRYGGRIVLKAVDAGPPPLELSRELRVEGPQAVITWLQLSMLLLALGLSLGLAFALHRRQRRAA